MGLPSSPSVKPKEVEKDTEKKTRGNPGKIPPHPLPKKKKNGKEGTFLSNFKCSFAEQKEKTTPAITSALRAHCKSL